MQFGGTWRHLITVNVEDEALDTTLVALARDLVAVATTRLLPSHVRPRRRAFVLSGLGHCQLRDLEVKFTQLANRSPSRPLVVVFGHQEVHLTGLVDSSMPVAPSEEQDGEDPDPYSLARFELFRMVNFSHSVEPPECLVCGRGRGPEARGVRGLGGRGLEGRGLEGRGLSVREIPCGQ